MPEVAVTVSVYLPEGVPLGAGGVGAEADPPPQPGRSTMLTRAAVSGAKPNAPPCPDSLRTWANIEAKITPTSAAHNHNGPRLCGGKAAPRVRASDGAVVVTLTVKLIAAVSNRTIGDGTEHVA